MEECDICYWRGEKHAEVTAYGGSKLKSQVEKLAEQEPDKVQIIRKNTDGSIFAHVPVEWVGVRRPRQVTMTEERKEELRERLRNIRKEKK